MIYLGIDTSNYKTSLAVVDEVGSIVSDISEYLDVPEGQRGLRQSDAFFKHSNRLPELLSILLKAADKDEIAAVGVSDKPRNIEGSYMPCFMAGVNIAKAISEILQIPVYRFSHQEGHAAAVLEYEKPASDSESCILMHLSGGTSEILLCKMNDRGYELELVGGTKDISFGQLLDRFGVALGYTFPSGMHIDKAASSYKRIDKGNILSRIVCKDAYFNLSGTEKQLMDFAEIFTSKYGKSQNFEESECEAADDLAAVSFEIMDIICDLLLRCTDQLAEKYFFRKTVLAGGVASSKTIRELIQIKAAEREYSIEFGLPKLSGDNAVGIALLAKRKDRLNK